MEGLIDEKTFSKMVSNKEQKIYKKIFKKNTNIEGVLKQGLSKQMKYTLASYLRFFIMHNCFLKAIEENLYKEDLSELNKDITKICIYFE